jgi:hypothetical protein
MTEDKQQEKALEVTFPEDLRGGRYCNNMVVAHSREEFVMDFMMVAHPAGAVTARIIMSPGHLKRTISALQDNLKKYEDKFGSIKEAVEPPTEKGKLGFRPQ